jgi:hypothetical protein
MKKCGIAVGDASLCGFIDHAAADVRLEKCRIGQPARRYYVGTLVH